LVGLGGVGVAIAEDDGAVAKGGEDDFGYGLGAVSEHESHLGGRGDGAVGGFGAGVEQNAADTVAEGRSSGLAKGDNFVSLDLKRGGEAAKLGGFSGAVEAFEGNEISARHNLQLIADGGNGILLNRQGVERDGTYGCIALGSEVTGG